MIRPTLYHSSKLNKATDENSHFTSTTFSRAITATSDKEKTLVSLQKPTTISEDKRENRAFITKVYESEEEDNDDDDNTEADTYLTSLKSIEDSPYHFPVTNMSHTAPNLRMNHDQYPEDQMEQGIQTNSGTYNDHRTNADELGDIDGNYQPNSITRQGRALTSTNRQYDKRRRLSDTHPMNDVSNRGQSFGNDEFQENKKERSLTPKKYRLLKKRLDQLRRQEEQAYEQDERENRPSHLANGHRQESQYPSSPQRPYHQSNLTSTSKQHESSNSRDQNDQKFPSKERDDVHQAGPSKNQTTYSASNSSPPGTPPQKIYERTDRHDEQRTGQSATHNQYRSEKDITSTGAQNQSSQLPTQSSDSSRRSQQTPNQYQIKSGTLEIRESPSSNSLYARDPNNTEMEMIFKTKFQGADDHERVKQFIQTTIGNQSDNLPPANIKEQQHTNRYPPINDNKDNDKLTTSDRFTPSGGTGVHSNKYDQEGDPSSDHSPSRPSQAHGRQPTQTILTPDSSVLVTPHQSLTQPRNKKLYFFGSNDQNKGSYYDSDDDEGACLTFGHGTQTTSPTDNSSKLYHGTSRNADLIPERDAATNTSVSLAPYATKDRENRMQQQKSGRPYGSPTDENDYAYVSDVNTSTSLNQSIPRNTSGNQVSNQKGFPRGYDDDDDEVGNNGNMYGNAYGNDNPRQPSHRSDEVKGSGNNDQRNRRTNPAQPIHTDRYRTNSDMSESGHQV
ncbi:hypothetical protein I4U23_029138 [Adineta vaga]|nr:hypothetical protein I4U23_029138 [Adineta vaga]